MKNILNSLQKKSFSLIAISLVWLLTCCNQESGTVKNKGEESFDPAKKEVWAEEIQSTTAMIQPVDYEDEYWKSINKNVNHEQIFNTIVNTVISGKLKAYDIVSDAQIPVEEVESSLTQQDISDPDNILETKLGGTDISTIRMREKWVFDKESLKLEKQVKRIDLLYAKYNKDGEYIGDRPLFYVNL